MKSLNRFVLVSLLFILPFNMVQASDDNSLCKPSGVIFGFFNGVNTVEEDAYDALRDLKGIHGETNADGEVIQYELFYNYTDGFEDFVETFEQRLLEQEGLLEGRFELFFEAMQGGGHWWDVIIDAVSSVIDILESFVDWTQAAIIDLLTGLVANPPTVDNYLEHKTRIDNWVIEGKKLLFVAHSQGNLFVNVAYDYALTKGMLESSVKVVHIAPASPSLRGEHVLADQDFVINGLRMVGSVPDITDDIPMYPVRKAGLNGEKDILGHGLLEIYLNPHIDISNSVKTYIDEALNSLEAPVMTATTGFFTATLIWDGRGDVDLHVTEPSGTHVYYRNPRGGAGHLDVDNMSANGPEHYYASCDANTLQTGYYQVGIANYSRAENRKATLQIASWNYGVLGTKSVILGEATGATPAYQLFNVTILNDPDTNEYSVSVE